MKGQLITNTENTTCRKELSVFMEKESLIPSCSFIHSRSHACFCHRRMVIVSMEIDIFLYLHLSVIDIEISPSEIRMPRKFWTKRASGTE